MGLPPGGRRQMPATPQRQRLSTQPQTPQRQQPGDDAAAQQAFAWSVPAANAADTTGVQAETELSPPVAEVSPSGDGPSLEELRQRRLQRFNQAAAD